MTPSSKLGWSAIAPIAIAAALTSIAASAQPAYQDHNGLTQELRQLASTSELAQLSSIGTSSEGRELWVVEIAAEGTQQPEHRPGLLIVANLEGDHLVGSALAVGTIEHLLQSEDAAATLKDNVVYVIPRLNPDGAESYFSTPQWNRRGNATPYDDDNDGRIDEDPPEDLNGDGFITQMRVLDTDGEYQIQSDELRLMAKADAAKGESGTHAVYWEGRDTDGDGFYNEDGPGGTDLNRNFQHAYPYWKADAGRYMVSESESRALMDFMVSHRNIAAILTFGHSDNLANDVDSDGNPKDPTAIDLERFASASNAPALSVGNYREGGPGGRRFGRFFGVASATPPLRGAQKGRDNDPASGRRPETAVNKGDQPYFKKVAETYKETTGVTETVYRRAPEGAFFQFGYFQFGVPSFSTPGWSFVKAETGEATPDEGDGSPSEETSASDVAATAGEATSTQGRGRPGGRGGRGGPPGASGRGGRGGASGSAAAADASDAALLKGLASQVQEGEPTPGFRTWESFDHPQLGAVEIGGFEPYALTNPAPSAAVDELGSKHGAFAVQLLEMLPKVSFADTKVTDHGGGIFTVTAEIENTGYFPTALKHGVTSRAVDPVTVQIQIEPEAVMTGNSKTSTVASLAGSGARESFTWIIRGKRGDTIDITLRAQKGGSDTTSVTLR